MKEHAFLNEFMDFFNIAENLRKAEERGGVHEDDGQMQMTYGDEDDADEEADSESAHRQIAIYVDGADSSGRDHSQKEMQCSIASMQLDGEKTMNEGSP